MTPGLMREMGRLADLAQATVEERGLLLDAIAPQSVHSEAGIDRRGQRLINDLRDRAEMFRRQVLGETGPRRERITPTK